MSPKLVQDIAQVEISNSCHLWFIPFYCQKGYRHSLTEKRKGKIYIIKQKFSHDFVFIGCTLS